MIAAELAKVARPEERPTELDEEDEGRAVRLFQAMATQWNWSVMGGTGPFGGIIGRVATGLRYEAMPAVAVALGLTIDRQLFADLQLIEAEALVVMAAR